MKVNLTSNGHRRESHSIIDSFEEKPEIIQVNMKKISIYVIIIIPYSPLVNSN